MRRNLNPWWRLFIDPAREAFSTSDILKKPHIDEPVPKLG
jgi:hypothetical protein